MLDHEFGTTNSRSGEIRIVWLFTHLYVIRLETRTHAETRARAPNSITLASVKTLEHAGILRIANSL